MNENRYSPRRLQHFCFVRRVVNPELQKRPVAVLSHNDGCIISRSDEVKKLGVPMAAPLFQYRELLEKNNTALISANHALYYDFSHRVMQVLTEDMGANALEMYSLDEAFRVGVPKTQNDGQADQGSLSRSLRTVR